MKLVNQYVLWHFGRSINIMDHYAQFVDDPVHIVVFSS